MPESDPSVVGGRRCVLELGQVGEVAMGWSQDHLPIVPVHEPEHLLALPFQPATPLPQASRSQLRQSQLLTSNPIQLLLNDFLNLGQASQAKWKEVKAARPSIPHNSITRK